MRIIRPADLVRMPWKNGGGETTEIAVSPEGSGLDRFDWRVSMARIARNGPFSEFAEVDRTLAVLDGAGVRLAIAERAPLELTASSAPLSFPADLPTTATLADGPVLDLNVMSRRGAFQHALTRLTIAGERQLEIDSSTLLLLCRSGQLDVEVSEQSATIQPEETLLMRSGAAGRWSLRARSPSVVFVIRVRPVLT